jgi:hypothetical protein
MASTGGISTMVRWNGQLIVGQDGVGLWTHPDGGQWTQSITNHSAWVHPFVVGSQLFVCTADALLVAAPAAPPSYTATAAAQVVNGFIVGAILADGGSGYTNSPTVTITGGGGSGAAATATVINGVVTSITITDAGSGYTSVPTITIAVPPIPPRRATGLALTLNGSVTAVLVTDPGYGYGTNPPAVRLLGGGGTGAKAVATVLDGVVTGITLIETGSGYTNTPTVRIATPPFSPSVLIGISRVKVTVHVVLGLKYQVQSSQDLVTWVNAGDPFVAEEEDVVQEFMVAEVGQFFRIQQVP